MVSHQARLCAPVVTYWSAQIGADVSGERVHPFRNRLVYYQTATGRKVRELVAKKTGSEGMHQTTIKACD